MKIVIVSGFPMSANPRAVKEACVLAEGGHSVTLIAGLFDLKTLDHDLSIAKRNNFSVIFHPDRRRDYFWQYQRIRRKFWILLGIFSVRNARQLGYSTPEMLRFCLKIGADLFIVHSEPGLWVGYQLIGLGHRVGVDIEDWYSENAPTVLGVNRQTQLLKFLEHYVLRNAAFAFTTSESMAQALSEDYECQRPLIVHNYPIEKVSDQSSSRASSEGSPLSICWFSQTIGFSRGLEDLIDAMKYIKVPFEIHLRGSVSIEYAASLRERADPQFRSCLFFENTVLSEELVDLVKEYDVGFAGEVPNCRNRDLTITNKILTYIAAGLPVVASSTCGQIEVAEIAPEAVRLYKSGDSKGLADQINALGCGAKRDAQVLQGLKAAMDFFSWDKSKQTILETAENS